ncbi:50S ribosomal protein L32, partial [Klebsiella pneumoniae]
VPGMTECPNCGEYKLSHRVCKNCGSYNGEEVVSK